MDSEILELLDDILSEAASIREFTIEHTFETYSGDKRTRFAVERCFEIIGEALNRIGKVDKSILDSIGNYRAIISFRNLLAHGYDHIEDKIVWGIIESDLKNLVEDIKRLR